MGDKNKKQKSKKYTKTNYSTEVLNKIHKDLRKYRYFYYEMSESLIPDYDYDMLEKRYERMCDRLGIKKDRRITNFVGFSYRIPFILVEKTP